MGNNKFFFQTSLNNLNMFEMLALTTSPTWLGNLDRTSPWTLEQPTNKNRLVVWQQVLH